MLEDGFLVVVLERVELVLVLEEVVFVVVPVVVLERVELVLVLEEVVFVVVPVVVLERVVLGVVLEEFLLVVVIEGAVLVVVEFDHAPVTLPGNPADRVHQGPFCLLWWSSIGDAHVLTWSQSIG